MAARISQQFVEVLRLLAPPPVRLTQQFLETLRTNAQAPLRVTQAWVEVLTGTFALPRVTQQFIEVLTLEPPYPDLEVAYTNECGQISDLAGDWPWEFTTTVGAIEEVADPSPMAVASTTSWEAAFGGDFEGGTEAGLTATYATTVGTETILSAGDPILATYQTFTASSSVYATSDAITFTTVVGARANRIQTFYDGRRDLINAARYRR